MADNDPSPKPGTKPAMKSLVKSPADCADMAELRVEIETEPLAVH